MDKVFIRNMVIFTCIVLACAGALLYTLVEGDRDIETSDKWVTHTHEVIIEAEQLATHMESMLASQRGYLITGNEEFIEEYETNKSNISQNIARLSDLLQNNPSQESRLSELRNYFNTFSQKLEERAEITDPLVAKRVLEDVNEIDSLRDNINRLNTNILQEEYELLKQRVDILEYNRSTYKSKLFVGVIFGTILLLIFNSFLLQVQYKRSRAERSLKSSEKRFALAVDGTQDGVFDWDIETGKVFYSKPFFKMLGYESKPSNGTTDDFKELLHPEDTERVWDFIEQYLDGNLSEYEQDFRLKHASGRWVWVKSRAKAIRNDDGDAVRMVGAHTDITALIKEQEKLTVAKKEAEEQNQAKSEFLAHMSHEIRTPLNAITGVGEILFKQKDDFNEKQAQLIKTLNSSARSLKELITDILDFSKIDSHEIELDERAFALDVVFEETISMMSLRAGEKGISFVFDYGAVKDDEFYGDSMRIRQILVNLVGNAIKFTDKGGVTVKCDFEERDERSYLRVDVSDTGIGIDPENFDLVFERFKQADSSVSRKYGGTGLGLPISKQLAKLMGGNIFLSSELGNGSTFSLLLPVKKALKGKGKARSERSNKKVNQQMFGQLMEDKRVLVVEDYEGNVVVVSYILEELKLSYDVARNGVEAVSQWRNNHYDLILMDVQMPEMDGFTATSMIRESEQKEKLERIPIIGMTAHALVGDKDKCKAAGMDAYLPKPLVEADLKNEIAKQLNKKKKKAA